MRYALYGSLVLTLAGTAAVAQVAGPAVGVGTTGAGIAAPGGASSAIGGGTLGPTSGPVAPGGTAAAFAGGTMGPNSGAAIPGGTSAAVGGGTLGPSNTLAAPSPNTGVATPVNLGGNAGFVSLATPNPGYALPALTVAATNPRTTTTALAARQTQELEAQGIIVAPAPLVLAPPIQNGLVNTTGTTPTQPSYSTTGAVTSAGQVVSDGMSTTTSGAIRTTAPATTAGFTAGRIDTFELGRAPTVGDTGAFQLPAGGAASTGTIRNAGPQ